MYLKDIKFLGHFHSVAYWKIRKPSNLSLSFITSFIYTPTYLKIREELLKEFDLKVDTQLLQEQKIKEFRAKYDRPLEKINKYVQALNLPRYISFELLLLIFSNTFVDLNNDFLGIAHVHNNRVLKEYAKGSEELGAIIFWQQMTKQQLIDWINENEFNFQPRNNKHLPYAPFYFDKFEDLAICDYVYFLHNQGKTTAQIQKLLDKKYPKRTDDFSDYWIINKLNRYKKRIEKYSDTYKLPENI